jgi:hypothetical protein
MMTKKKKERPPLAAEEREARNAAAEMLANATKLDADVLARVVGELVYDALMAVGLGSRLEREVQHAVSRALRDVTSVGISPGSRASARVTAAMRIVGMVLDGDVSRVSATWEQANDWKGNDDG